MAISSAASPPAVAGYPTLLRDGHDSGEAIGSSASSALQYLPPAAAEEMQSAQTRIDVLRARLAGSSFVAAMDVVISSTTDASTRPTVRLPAPSGSDLRRVAVLAPALREPVAGLAAAVREAEAIIGRVPARDVARAVTGFYRTLSRSASSMAPDRTATSTMPTPIGAIPTDRPPPVLAALTDFRPPTPPSVERAEAMAPLAAGMVAAALDQYMPALRAAAGAPVPRTAAPECDLVHEPPVLCVGSALNNTYTEDVALLIDLGGDDTYRNSAGGAPFDAELSYGLVSVNVDLGGHDRYVADRSTAIDFPSGAPETETVPVVVAQGTGLAGSVGILLDTEGDDTYAAHAPVPTPEAPLAAAAAQGTGIEGMGALFDLGGNDAYSVDGPATSGKGNVVVSGQAAGAGGSCTASGFTLPGGGGVIYSCRQTLGGILIDQGGGRDSYRLDAGRLLLPPEETVQMPGQLGFPLRWALGQGQGWSGASVLFDDGGEDAFSASASTSAPGRGSFDDQGPLAVVWAQGSAFGGSGLLLEGPGDTTYDIDVSSDGMTFLNGALGQGAVYSDGLAVLDDLGGDDRYEIRSTVSLERDLILDDGCKCGPSFSVSAFPSFNLLIGQGTGFVGLEDNLGLLRDQGGNDSYSALAGGTVRVSLTDERTNPSSRARLDLTPFAPAAFNAQGVGYGSARGSLIDENGNDEYTATSRNEASADGSSAHGEAPYVVAVSPFVGIPALAQGAALGAGDVGALIDLAGSGDRFEATDTRSISTPQDPRGGFQVGSVWPAYQGSGFSGEGVLAALGESPVIVSHPSRPVCELSPGYRGFGTWQECQFGTSDDPGYQAVDGESNFSGGQANGATGLAPSLRFTADTPSEASLDDHEAGPKVARVPVGAVLLSPQGEPLAGRVVHFDLQSSQGGLDPVKFGWANLWQVDAVTDAYGVARAAVPLLQTASLHSFGYQTWRILATFDGEAGLYPRHVAQTLALS
ncbi:MAG: hypothetical protein ACRDH9_03530 [Actinomycetota bacterium]